MNNQTMTHIDILRMLKEIQVLPTLVHKSEATRLLHLVNANESNLRQLEFEGFVHYLLQLSMFIFSRKPIDLRMRPPIESLQ